MTELLAPLFLEVLTSSVLMDHANLGQVSFCTTDGQHYTFLINRRSLERLAKQIEKALREAPSSRRERRTVPR
jgi:hypothetical protein